MASLCSSSEFKKDLWKKLKDEAIESLRNYYAKHCELKHSFSPVDPGGGLLHRLATKHSEDTIFVEKAGNRETVIYRWDIKAALSAIEFLPKSGIITAVTYLEEYVNDILGKLYETLYEHLTFRELKLLWPDNTYPPFLQNEEMKNIVFKQVYNSADGKLDDNSIEDAARQHKTDTMNKLDKPTWEAVKTCLENLFGTPDSSRASTTTNLMQEVLKKLPTLTNPDSILGWRLQYEINQERRKYKIFPHDESTLENVANFYYGIRCMFAHGNPSKTIKSGVLEQHNSMWNFQITELQIYVPEVDNKQVDVILRLCQHVSIEKTKRAGITKCKVETTVTREDAKIVEVKERKTYDDKEGKWIAESRDERELDEFNDFLTCEDRDQGIKESKIVQEAKKAVSSNYVNQWSSAQEVKLAPNYSLYLSTANFCVFYANIIAVLGLAKCFSVIHGSSKQAKESLDEILLAINKLRQDTDGMLFT